MKRKTQKLLSKLAKGWFVIFMLFAFAFILYLMSLTGEL